MGDYYSIRFKAQLTGAGRESVALLLQQPYTWESVPGFEHYAQMERADSIPFGGLAYAPREWRNRQELVEATWHVCCSIKKPYYDTLEAFLGRVLPRLLSAPCVVEVWDEYDFRIAEVTPA